MMKTYGEDAIRLTLTIVAVLNAVRQTNARVDLEFEDIDGNVHTGMNFIPIAVSDNNVDGVLAYTATPVSYRIERIRWIRVVGP